MRSIRLSAIAALLLIASLMSQALPARALAPLPTPDSAWFGGSSAGFSDGAIAGVPYHHAMVFHLQVLGSSLATSQAETSLNVSSCAATTRSAPGSASRTAPASGWWRP